MPQQPVSPLPPPDGNAQAAAETAQAATVTALALLVTPPAPVATETPLPATQPLSATAVITTTPLPTALIAQNPVEFPTPTPPTNFTGLFVRVVNMSITAAGWIWFLCGSLIFFVTAGVLAGVGFRRQERRRYTMIEQTEPTYRPNRTSSSAPRPTPEATPGDEDNWPVSLP